jgi:2-polyprenyl-3-methyl-5-hydroxy-6-metoxy-1,4-benzoquinol methylase
MPPCEEKGSGMTAFPDFSKRAELVEKMDKPDCDQAVLFATLSRFEQTNRLFTRYRTVLQRHLLSDLRRQPEREYRLTDLGAGGCDIARWLVRVCRSENLHLTIRAIDQDPRVVQFARLANAGYPEIEVVQADACDPACWGKPDYLFAQHLLHHLPDAACIQLLRTLDQANLRRFVLSDLTRSRLAYHAFRIAALPLGAGTWIVEDGSASILRGFREQEIREMIKQAALKRPASIYRLWPSRLVVVGGWLDTLTPTLSPEGRGSR